MNVTPIRVGTPALEGANVSYLLENAGYVGPVDTGIPTESTRDQLRRGLTEHGYGFEDVQAVFMTHYHPDHSGLAGDIQSADHAVVYVHKRDAPLIENADAAKAFVAARDRCLEERGTPEPELDVIRDSGVDDFRHLVTQVEHLRTVRNGQSVRFGDEWLTVLHTPGHTAGSTCYIVMTDDSKHAFIGDHV
jgi:glyoxylase-like metal-dependent hydrolase (beta-lactamase superfamily II)